MSIILVKNPLIGDVEIKGNHISDSMVASEQGATARPLPVTGDNVRKWREAAQMSPEQFATALGVDKKTVCRWEGGQTSPPLYLGFALNWLGEKDRYALYSAL